MTDKEAKQDMLLCPITHKYFEKYKEEQVGYPFLEVLNALWEVERSRNQSLRNAAEALAGMVAERGLREKETKFAYWRGLAAAKMTIEKKEKLLRKRRRRYALRKRRIAASTEQSHFARQAESARKEMETWNPDRIANVRLQGRNGSD